MDFQRPNNCRKPEPKIVILIGPYGSGKTKVSHLLSAKLRLRYYGIDEEYYRYLKQIVSNADEVANALGVQPRYSLLHQQCNAYVVEEILQTILHRGEDAIIDFGADHSIYPDTELFNKVQILLLPYEVILLLPSKNLEESSLILWQRVRSHGLKGTTLKDAELLEWIQYAIQHPSNSHLAKHIVYTKERTPEETFVEICGLIGADCNP